MSEGPVLVVGASGRTGRLIVGRLVERRVSVHALVRDPAKGREVLPPDVPQFVGDVRRSETLTEPIAGARSVISVACGSVEHGVEHGNSAEMVDYYGTCHLIQQASAANVDLIVFVSTIYATRPDHYQDVEPTSLGWKARAEEVIRRSRLPYCIIRPGWLTDGSGGEPLIVSQGDTSKAGSHGRTSPTSARNCSFSQRHAERLSRWSGRRQGRRRASHPPSQPWNPTPMRLRARPPPHEGFEWPGPQTNQAKRGRFTMTSRCGPRR